MRVKCVSNKNGGENDLEEGKIYEVVAEAHGGSEYELKGVWASWRKDRFVEVLKVRVTNATHDNWYHVGDEYEILNKKRPAWSYNGEYYPLVNDEHMGLGEGHFEIVPDESVPDEASFTYNNGLPICSEDVSKATPTIDSHYNFTHIHKLSEAERESGEVVLKIDPYFVNKVWGLSSKDDTGVVFHLLKTLARYSHKNSKEREITAIYKSIKRLAELEGVQLK